MVNSFKQSIKLIKIQQFKQYYLLNILNNLAIHNQFNKYLYLIYSLIFQSVFNCRNWEMKPLAIFLLSYYELFMKFLNNAQLL